MGRRRYDREQIIDALNQAAADGVITQFAVPVAGEDGVEYKGWRVHFPGHPSDVELTTAQAWALGVGIEAARRALATTFTLL